MSLTFIGVGVLLLLALINDAGGTIKLVVAIITIRGVVWLVQKTIAALNRDGAEIINFAGWCLAAIPGVKLIKTAITGLPEMAQKISDTTTKVSGFFSTMDAWFQKVDDFLFMRQ